MSTFPDFGWHDDRHCPEWCTSTDHHLGWRLTHGSDGFWHKGPVTKIALEDEDYNCNPLAAEVYISQHVQVDERGHYTHPAEVCIEGYTLTPANARKLAAVLLDLADRAEQAAHSKEI